MYNQIAFSNLSPFSWLPSISLFAVNLFLITHALANAETQPPKLSSAQDYYTYFNSEPIRNDTEISRHARPKNPISDYFVSEKLDGVRGYWDGKKLLSRNGHIFHAPLWFTKDLPNTPLDGELWIARGQFEKVVSIVRKKHPIDEEWQQVKYCVFDLPASEVIFSERLKILSKIILADSKPMQLVKQFRVKNEKTLFALLDKIEQLGGEGLMLHHQSAFYRQGDNHDLLKLKVTHDAEAKVLGYKPGQGKYFGMMGSLKVENEEGVIFHIGTGFSDQQRKHPPKISEIVTYRYRGLTRYGVPKHASFLRIRYDDDL